MLGAFRFYVVAYAALVHAGLATARSAPGSPSSISRSTTRTNEKLPNAAMVIKKMQQAAKEASKVENLSKSLQLDDDEVSSVDGSSEGLKGGDLSGEVQRSRGDGSNAQGKANAAERAIEVLESEPLNAAATSKSLNEPHAKLNSSRISSMPSRMKLTTKMTHIVMRHGQRTPKFVLPNDDRKSWPDHVGPGMLTVQGAKDMIVLGHTIRMHYVDEEHVVSPTYVRNEVYARSTDIDRTLQSAESFFRGFYPASRTALVPPVHTVPSAEEFLLRGYDHCRKYHQFVSETLASQKFANEFSKDLALFEKLSSFSGVRVSPANIKAVADTILLVRNFMNNEKTSIDTKNKIATLSAQELQRLKQIHDRVNYLMKSDRSMSRLMVGNLLREVFERMAAMVQGVIDSDGQGPPKFVLYSAHDTTLMGILSAVGSVDALGQSVPPFGSHLEFDLREDDKSQFYLRLRYNGRAIRLGKCPADCPIRVATEFLEPFIPNSLLQWNIECGNEVPDGVGISRERLGQLRNSGHDPHSRDYGQGPNYLGLDWDEWSTMAFLLACVLVLENVIFEWTVSRFMRELYPLHTNLEDYRNRDVKEIGEGPRGGSLLKKSKNYYSNITGSIGKIENNLSDDSTCCSMRKQSVCCAFWSVFVMALCLIFLIAFGVDWDDWPAVCFIIVSIISFEAVVIVGFTVYQRCLGLVPEGYEPVPTHDSYYDDDGTLSDTL